MKRKARDDEEHATATGFEQPDRPHQLKRRRATPPNTHRPSLPPPGDNKTLRGRPVDRVSEWLDSLPESRLSLVDAESSNSDPMPSDAANSTPRRHQPGGASSSHASGTSRSSSPSKPSPQNYRAQVLRRLDIHVDAPVPDETLRQLLPAYGPALDPQIVDSVAQVLHSGARELLERQTANEAEWATLLSAAINSLVRALPGDQRLCCLPNRDWQAALKPIAYTHRLAAAVPQKRCSPSAPSAGGPNQSQGGSTSNINNNNDNANANAAALHHSEQYPTPGQTTPVSGALPFASRPDMPPPTTPRLRLEPAPARLQPRTPRPDLTVGLGDSDAAWAEDEDFWMRRAGLPGRDVRDILIDLQAVGDSSANNGSGGVGGGGGMAENGPVGGALVTDPCTAMPSGLRFPFLVVEAKSGGSATVAEAENQAAVAGACALRVLRGVSGGHEARQSSPPSAGDGFCLRTFSLTTDGPTHSLWAHLHGASSRIDMVWLGVYRVTNQASALGLVQRLAGILYWGATDMRDWVWDRVAQYLGQTSNG